MQTISPEKVAAIWQELSQMTQTQAADLAARMQEEQPAILVYLLAAEQADEATQDAGWLMEIGALIWWAMTREAGPLPMVTPEQLDAAEDANIRFLEQLDEGSEINYHTALQSLAADYNQMPLFGHTIGQLMADATEEPELVDEGVGLALLRLKTVIDTLDQASDGAGSRSRT
ncbi:MAG: hypothetical protein H7A45_16980 [Verrucomicrobiales bacterium]|nr:hypothetical protein [Verrucomicrobiales bacterium]MCP5525654.1 hypothetical protein [Verrucomicrobiales bacterium]